MTTKDISPSQSTSFLKESTEHRSFEDDVDPPFQGSIESKEDEARFRDIRESIRRHEQESEPEVVPPSDSGTKLPDCYLFELTAPARNLARSLMACIVDDDKLQGGLLRFLHEQDQESQLERRSGLESVILEALLSCCHEKGRSAVRVAATFSGG